MGREEGLVWYDDEEGLRKRTSENWRQAVNRSDAPKINTPAAWNSEAKACYQERDIIGGVDQHQ